MSNKIQFVDIENTLPAIMVERVSCIYWDYPSISMFSPDLSSTVKWSFQTMIRSSRRFTRTSSKASRCAGCSLMIFILFFGKLPILFKLIGKLNVVSLLLSAYMSFTIPIVSKS